MKRLILTALAVVAIVLAGTASVNGNEKVTLCHAAGLDGTTKYVTLEVGWNAAYGPAGHFYENGTPRAGHEQDYLGACVPPPPTPTPSPTATPTPTPSPTPSPTPEPTVTPSPSTPPSTPFPTPPPTSTDATDQTADEWGLAEYTLLFVVCFLAGFVGSSITMRRY